MFRQRQTVKSTASPASGAALRSSFVLGKAFRLSAAMLIVLSSVPLAVGITASLRPGQLASGLKVLEDWRDHAFAAAKRHFDLPQSTGAQRVQAPAWQPAVAPASTVGSGGQAVLSYGDRLKITFYESLGVALGDGGNGHDQTIATIFPRMDLSAEYSVDEGGRLNIPRLGEFPAAGRPIAAVQSAMSTAFVAMTGRPADVQVAIVERQPIYVLGTVRNAGAFKHAPGMTLLQALADAGGISSDTAHMSWAIEGIRETQRLHQAEARLDRLLIDRARLVALNGNSNDLTLPTSITSRLSGAAARDGLKAAVEGAQAALTLERARYQQQLSLAERQVSIANIELDAQNTRVEQLGALLAKKSERLHGLEGIASKGSVPQFKLTDVGADVAETIARREDLRVSLAQSQRRLIEAQMAMVKIQLDHAAGIERDLSAIQQEIEDCSESIAAMRAVTLVLQRSIPEIGGGAIAGASVPSFTVVRRVADHVTTFAATETTPLVPGDVVRVELASRADTTATGRTHDVTSLQK